MRLYEPLLLLLAAAAAAVVANVEKVVFSGPAPAPIPLARPTLSDLHLAVLTPDRPALRANLSRVFPATAAAAQGQPAWLLLRDLAHGRRYELRVCWAAIDPTSFALRVYELDTVWQTPELIQSLAEYAASRRADPFAEKLEPQLHEWSADDAGEHKASVLLLHLVAAADYFTDNAELMRDPPPVLVDLILDPFLYNLVPRSLVPTAGYLVLVGVVTWFVARWVASSLQSVAGSVESQAERQK